MSVIEYLKKNVSMAFKTLFWRFGRYACFFILLFLLQCLFSTILLLRVNIQSHQRDYLEEQYTNSQGYVYHLRLLGLSDSQFSIVRYEELSQKSEMGSDEEGKERYFMIAGGTQYERQLTTGTSYRVYDVDIQFTGDNIRSCYSLFADTLFTALNDEGEFSYFETPLLTYELDSALQGVLTVLMIVLILALSALILWVLRSTLTAHDRFTYGIYLSFGADFKTLFMTAFWEMVILNLILLIPSAVVGHLCAWLIYRSSDLAFSIHPELSLLSMALTLIASLIAAFVDFRHTASEPPVKLLASSDNGDFISSPKTSGNILACLFPKGVEGITLRRYRKYMIRILSFTLLFSVLFSSAAYFSTLYSQALNSPKEQYHLSFAPTLTEIEVETGDAPDSDSDGEDQETVTETETVIVYDYTYEGEIAEIIESMPGIAMIEKSCVTAAVDINSYVLFDPDRVKRSAGGVDVTVRSDDGVPITMTGLCNAEYSVLDEQIVRYMESMGYGVKGSLADVLENENMIAISESFNNTKEFKLKVGDTVRIAVSATPKDESYADSEIPWSDYDNYLTESLRRYSYKYQTYTVGAILSDLPTEGCFPIYMNAAAYRQVTGEPVLFTEVGLILDDSVTKDDLHYLDINLRNAADSITNLTVTDLNTRISKQVTANRGFGSLLIFLSVILLLTVPLIWTLSQTLFYQRRWQEFDMYFAMGANGQEVKQLFRFDGIIFAVLGAGSYAILGTVFTYLVNRLTNNPYLYRILSGEDRALYFHYHLPWLLILAGTLVMGACGYLGVVLSCRNYFAKAHPVFVGERQQKGKKQKKQEEKEGA
ncbi:MAG: FtsX-like permease family protein [Eubacteriales bacterium]